MTASTPIQRMKSGWIFAILLAVLGVVILNGLILHYNFQKVSDQEDWVRHTYEVVRQLNLMRSERLEGEVALSDYRRSGSAANLNAFHEHETAAEAHFKSARSLTGDNSVQNYYATAAQNLIDRRQAALAKALQELKPAEIGARTPVFPERDLQSLDGIIDDMKSLELHLLEWRTRISERNKVTFFVVLLVTTALSLIVILFTFYSVRTNQLRNEEDARARLNEAQENEVIAEAAAALAGEVDMVTAASRLATFFSERLGFVASRIYLIENGKLSPLGEDSAKGPVPALVADAAKRTDLWQLADVPRDYWKIASGLGETLPSHLVFLPLRFQRQPIGVIEAASIGALPPASVRLMAKLGDTISIALNAARSRRDLQILLETTQQQAEELQTQQEELKVNNEELEEQSKVLRESQARLEQQQQELEQTNQQLEEQAQILENQRSDLERKTADLRSASQYKSEFLANMSHELRTPLNSSLILAKLLAENSGNRLSKQEVEYAETIHASGIDLLNLINDILDLAKVEAGKMEINPETLSLTSVFAGMERLFGPVAREKKLTFHCENLPNTPLEIESDRQRLDQVLKNLLSNAFKFTEKGEVRLTASANPRGGVIFSVTDTGLGIPRDQQEAIFEAFRQVDGTNNRKYGGTGLGLSISRELAALLGGRIEVKSELGRGSEFRLLLPSRIPAGPPRPRGELPPASAPRASSVSNSSSNGQAAPIGEPLPAQIPDDRDRLTAGTRILLAIEDDPSFAKILYALATELGFQCLLASTGKEGIRLAQEFVPSGILLDVVLPDQTGIAVLDQLKHNPRTRHIPVHVISSHDQPHSVLEKGAMGFIQKPVEREGILAAIRRLETKLTQALRRILVVEDHPAQRQSIVALLGAPDTEIVAVGTGREAIEQIDEFSFDCVVIDLSLPDMTGFELLSRISARRDAPFPPVIVYTGRDLSREEEAELNRYSKSIIVKGARSPERLLDDVSLFVHRLESTLSADKQRILHDVRVRDEALEGKKILIVDDDARNIFALLGLLEMKGLQVIVGRNGREAIAKLEAEPGVQLVLMDIMMPEMDGYEAIRAIRKQPRFAKLPIIAVTAKAMSSDYNRSLEAGANDYLAKPIDSDKLLSLIRVWIARA